MSQLPTLEPKLDQLQLIVDRIINLLDLDGNEKKDEILNDLFHCGQPSLRTYKDYLIPVTYNRVMNDSDSELIKQLRNYFEEQWKRQYQSSNSVFTQFFDEIKSNDRQPMYEKVLLRTAKYGKKYMKNCTILSISLQMFFEGIDDQCLEDTAIFEKLWYAITLDGIQSVRQYSDYITADHMEQQLNNKQSMLFQSLREYYRQELIPFFQQCNIKDQQNLYQLALDHLTESGWKIGLEDVADNIAPTKFQALLEKVDVYLKEQSN